jgi:hypothetical protein
MRFAVFLALVVSLGACNRTPPAPEASAAPKEVLQPVATKAVPQPVTTEVAEDAGHLPGGFVGVDINALFLKLRNAGKSEFETTDAYKRRLAEEARVYSFLVEPMESSYNADRAQMLVRLRMKVDASTTDIKEHSLMVPVLHKVERSTFPASNAFGVKVEV